jgi:hypothetical protein
MLEIELLAKRVKELNLALRMAQAEMAMKNLRIMQMEGIIRSLEHQTNELKEFVVRQAQELEYHEIADLERSWQK